jgi:hypothetical protein
VTQPDHLEANHHPLSEPLLSIDMSVVDQALPLREELSTAQGRSMEQSFTNKSRSHQQTYSPSSDTYDHSVLDTFYVEDEDVMPSSPKQSSQKASDAPALPQRSALRASKLLASFDLKLAGPVVDTAEIAQATPHDFYLSSEEDASSSADDFSDYDWDSDIDEPNSPASRRSREDTARVVSVIYSGKPSIIDLSLIRRSISPNSEELRSRATLSTESLPKRPSSPASISSAHPPRQSSMLESLLSRPQPNFLHIDPYANGSTYSLTMPARAATFGEEPPRTPRTPTSLMQGMSRTLSLVRKRSRPALASLAAGVKSRDAASGEHEPSASASLESSVTFAAQEVETASLSSAPRRNSRSMTYSDIMQFVQKNNRELSHPPAPSTPVSEASPVVPRTPTTAQRLLGSFSARRKSIHRVTGIL